MDGAVALTDVQGIGLLNRAGQPLTRGADRRFDHRELWIEGCHRRGQRAARPVGVAGWQARAFKLHHPVAVKQQVGEFIAWQMSAF